MFITLQVLASIVLKRKAKQSVTLNNLPTLAAEVLLESGADYSLDELLVEIQKQLD